MAAQTRISPARIVRLLGDWAEPGTSVTSALTRALGELVDSAALPAGWQMPSERALAEALGVARGTVSRVYDELRAYGRLASRSGSGTFVRGRTASTSPPAAAGDAAEGRLTSFAGHHAVVDLSSGALPGTELVAHAMVEVGRLLHEHHLQDSGYHPAGLPELRAALAERFTQQGLVTSADEILVTAGSQQAVWLIASVLAGPGTVTVVEDPTYRGALEAFAGAGTRLVGVPLTPTGPDLNLLAAGARTAAVLYLQPALHNPTGIHTPLAARTAIGEIAAHSGAYVVDDQSQADLGWFTSRRLHGLEHRVAPDRLLLVGTLSKLFWGGVRVGWIRGPREIIGRLTTVRAGVDLSGSVLDQLTALLLLPANDEQRALRRDFLVARYRETARTLRTVLPSWQWNEPAGGSGLWVNTGTDAVTLAQRALLHGVRLTPGPSFSPHGGSGTYLRVPMWHQPDAFEEAAHVLAELLESHPATP